MLRYYIKILTNISSMEIDHNSPEVYLCLHGEHGDTGRRLLLQKPREEENGESSTPVKKLFIPGEVSKKKGIVELLQWFKNRFKIVIKW